ncbi:M3 family oligoendopeptidase [Bacillus sp. CGMCC 1.16607]|uniref:M3 family oligoendopeptidase n=1 Tax=Bacillus sp. CGMCC 1.16607 TaxID=3351842 RepID=UPI00362CBD26
MTKTMYPEVWDLDVFFPGGSESPQLRNHLDSIIPELISFEEKVKQFQVPQAITESTNLAKIMDEINRIRTSIGQANSFIGCLLAQNTTDKKASLLQGEVSSINARFKTSMQKVQKLLTKTEDTVWQGLLETDELAKFEFILNEWRNQAKQKLSEEEESLITALTTDGYESWGQLYNSIVGGMKVKVNLDGEEKELSVGQANNLRSNPDETIRKESYAALEEAWLEKEDLFANILNHLAGFRLQVYKKRGWEQVLQEPLQYNRMKQETLDAMWGAINKHKQPFVEYLNQKAKLLGKEKMEWHDMQAPVSKSTQKMPYQDAAQFILKHFGQFGPELETFARKAFEEGWIEAEDRPNKRVGGFCTSLPQSEQSRIFMTYSGTIGNMATLAHELGHAFHSYALRPVDGLNRQYAMNVAETASTFAEMIVFDAAVKEAATDEEKIYLLEEKVKRSMTFFMGIHFRFLFETRFYEERKKGMVSAARLNELMVQAQEEAYIGALGSFDPHSWANTLHFYITYVPFYNFPYTFGYLFSLSIYAKALEEGQGFEEKYMALLRDTAIMSVEDLAMKHLGEDITQESFWEKGISLSVKDAEEFIKLTSSK